ncbi:MAG: hypothetical protein ACYDCK_07515 [Thermoplasmatota archaeon]
MRFHVLVAFLVLAPRASGAELATSATGHTVTVEPGERYCFRLDGAAGRAELSWSDANATHAERAEIAAGSQACFLATDGVVKVEGFASPRPALLLVTPADPHEGGVAFMLEVSRESGDGWGLFLFALAAGFLAARLSARAPR